MATREKIQTSRDFSVAGCSHGRVRHLPFRGTKLACPNRQCLDLTIRLNYRKIIFSYVTFLGRCITPKDKESAANGQFTAQARSSCNRSESRSLTKNRLLFPSYCARIHRRLGESRLESFRSAFSNKVRKHLCSGMRTQDRGLKVSTVPPWCREAHQHSQGGTVHPIRDILNRTLT